MPLTVGSRIGPYEVLGVLGAGGMGEVYRARDTKLQRDVAIKVLPAAMADNPRRLMRFEREARALAALNHPNIATVYGIEEPSDDATHSRALIMELVAGEDLSWRLKRGPLPLADALPIAKQVAEALAAAHDAGIVHRDLKPANIKVRADGTVKVLDFGLATDRATETESSSGSGSGSASGSASGSGTADLPNTQTLGAELTEDGAVLGTAAYMAPEQAKGQPVDKRADIWAFGIVLFEMLAGRRPFAAPTGSDPADTMARVLAADPDWSGLPAATPPPVRRLLARCLTKDRKQRLHDIADARLEIDEAMAPQLPGSWTASARETAAAGARRRLRTVLLVALGLAAGIAIGVAIWRPAADGSLPVTYARIGVLPAAEVDAGGVHPAVVLPTGGARTALAWSPDGRRLAFIGARDGVRQIYIRDLSSEIARALAGTEGAGALAFSPDGNEVAFWSDGALRRVQVDGGPPATVCASGTVSGITWGAGRIIFTPGGLWTADLSGSGSECRPLRQPPELVRYASPLILPGGTAVLYTELTKQWTSGDERVMALPLTPGGEPTLLLSNAADAHFLPSGHLAFLRQGTIFVVPFDARSLQLSGEPVAVLQNVAQSTIAWDSADLTLAGQFSVSSQGALAYIAAPPAAPAARELVSIDRQGTATSLGAPVKGYRNHVEISPDGRRLAVAVQTTTDVQLFSFDLARQTLSRVAESIHGEVVLGAWARDGRIAVGVVDGGKISTAIVRPDVSSPAEPVPDTTGFWPSTFSPDGRLAGMKEGGVWVYSLGANGAPPHAVVTSRAEIRSPAWSPDGRWIAYASATTGRSEVYVRPVQGPGEAVMVSTQGGNSPAWNPNGRELFFIAPGALEKMMAAAFTASGKVTRLTELFAFAPGQSFGATVFASYAVAPDGQRFYASRPLSGPRRQATEINVVFNWLDTIQRQPPVKR